MKMSEKTLLKKIEQAFKENCCNGSYKLELDAERNDYTYYVLFYTYETGETIALNIDISWLGEVKFYSPVHSYYISNFNNHTKSVINVLRVLFDMIDSNKDDMVNYYKIKTEETPEKEDCKTVKEKSNPEWHHVSLATLANIDIDMLDEKRQRYFKIYKELIKTVNDLHKCKTAATYETRCWRFKQVIADDMCYRGTTLYMTRFLDSKISMCNVECGLWSSADEKATSFIKSRRYSSTTLK